MNCVSSTTLVLIPVNHFQKKHIYKLYYEQHTYFFFSPH